jgi:hypothetical protein
MIQRLCLSPICGGALLGLALLTAAGCGGKGGASIEGSVTLDNEPVDGGVILFFPPGKADAARADIVNGKYTVEAGKGPPPGKYRVEIVWYKKTGKQVVSKNDPPHKEDETIPMIPKKYNEQSTLSAEITAGTNTVNFNLLTKK